MSEAKQVRKCLFCENIAKSREHIWPEWLLSLVQRKPYRQRLGQGAEMVLTVDFKAKCVCKDCNNGWMSDLESNVRTILAPLARDMAIPLNEADQRLITTWALKTSFVLEATKPRHIKHFYRESDGQTLREKGVLIGANRVWIGRFTQSGLASNASDFTLKLAGEAKDAHGVVTTMVVGHVVLQILSIRFPEEMTSSMVNVQLRPGPWDNSLQQIHPYQRTVLWPPSVSHNNGPGQLGLELLKYRWNTSGT